MIKINIGLHAKYRCYSCQIVMKLEFYEKKFQITDILKIIPVVPWGRTDGRI